MALALEDYQKIAAEHRNRLVATVRVARELRADDERAAGRRRWRGQYGRPVHLNVVVDPDVIGGMRVAIGDDVIDGTVVQPPRRGPTPARRLSRQARSRSTRPTEHSTTEAHESERAGSDMTELSIRPEEIRDALQRFVSDYKPETASREEVGTRRRGR